MDSAGTALDEICAPTIPGSVDLAEPEEVPIPAPQRLQRRMGYFDLHPERRHMQVGGDGGDMLDEFAQAAGGAETPPRRSDTTESVYSSGQRHQPRRRRPSPDLILNGFIQTPPLAPSPPFPCAGCNAEPTDTDIYST